MTADNIQIITLVKYHCKIHGDIDNPWICIAGDEKTERRFCALCLADWWEKEIGTIEEV